ncbi:hypothetical protein BE21_57515 [Sorangium cellulosum]|uniref:Phage tail protein n=1 Tax=Sorangium cellulosum TaxID=56 RepID=A0A150U354_SORCE|nr:hypothetical protein BE21_57515 [Sorangium cellulosum]
MSGTKFYGVVALNWKEELTGEVVYAAGPEPYGETMGEYKASADVEMYLSEFARLLQKLGNGYGQKRFNFGGTWRETPGDGINKIELINCRIISSEASNSKGSGPATVKANLSIISPIKINGLTMIDRLYSTGTGGNLLTAAIGR